MLTPEVPGLECRAVIIDMVAVPTPNGQKAKGISQLILFLQRIAQCSQIVKVSNFEDKMRVGEHAASSPRKPRGAVLVTRKVFAARTQQQILGLHGTRW